MLRLTLLTLVCLFGAMTIFGSDLSDHEAAGLTNLRGERISFVSRVEGAFGTSRKQRRFPETIQTATATQTVYRPLTGPAAAPLVQPASYQIGSSTPLETPRAIASTTQVSDPAKLAALVQPEAAETSALTLDLRVVTASRVNVRSGPSTQNGVLGQVLNADIVQVMDTAQNGWVKIIVQGGGVEGYMSAKFLVDYQG